MLGMELDETKRVQTPVVINKENLEASYNKRKF